jgi:hypothetical protein
MLPTQIAECLTFPLIKRDRLTRSGSRWTLTDDSSADGRKFRNEKVQRVLRLSNRLRLRPSAAVYHLGDYLLPSAVESDQCAKAGMAWKRSSCTEIEH